MQTYFWQTFDEEGMPTEDKGGLKPKTGGDLIEAINDMNLQDLIPEEHIHQAAMDVPIE